MYRVATDRSPTDMVLTDFADIERTFKGFTKGTNPVAISSLTPIIDGETFYDARDLDFDTNPYDQCGEQF